jgi:membrane-associated phospholipid phosphatase
MMELEHPLPVIGEPQVNLPRWRWLASKSISAVMSPPLMITAGLLYLSRRLGAEALPWALFQIVIAIFIPVLFIVVQVQRGAITDIHMRLREQRIAPLALTLALALMGWAVMYIYDAPAAFIVFGGIAVLQGGFMLLMTLRWKISGHSMAIASLAVFMVGMLGWPAAPALAAIPLVAWARISLDRHSLMQTVVGTAAGVAFTVLALGIYTAR